MTLYDLTDTYKEFQALVDSGEIEMADALDTLEAIKGDIDDKADNIACILKGMTAEAEAIKAEENALEKRRKAIEGKCKDLKEYLSKELLKANKPEVLTPRNKITFRHSSALEILDEKALEAWAKNNLEYGAVEVVPQVKYRKENIAAALNGGMKVPGVEIVERQNIQIK